MSEDRRDDAKTSFSSLELTLCGRRTWTMESRIPVIWQKGWEARASRNAVVSRGGFLAEETMAMVRVSAASLPSSLLDNDDDDDDDKDDDGGVGWNG